MRQTPFRRDRWLVLGLALLVRILAAWPQQQPNYMDAAYYLVGGQQLAQGYGFNDPYVWNYLDAPASLPHPSHLYWMPLPSILVALSQLLFGLNYRAAQLPFVLLSALLPLIAYAVAWRTTQRRRHAWFAALVTMFSPFYLAYWGVPESFAPFAIFGSMALILSSGPDRFSWRRGILAGVCAGLAHLSRADGVLLLMPMLISVEFRIRTPELNVKRSKLRWRAHGTILAGYVLVMAPWFIRNLSVVGAPLPSTGTQMAWVCNYDELFAYGVHLDVNHLLNCGLDQVVAAKLNGLASGGVHLIAEDGLVFLAPVIAIGLWRLRREPVFQSVLMYLGLLFVVMTLVFTFAGDRGGLFHSTSALLPFFYAAAPTGLDAIISWVAGRRRNWRVKTAQVIFTVAGIALTMGLGLVIYRGRVIGSDARDPVWNQADRDLAAIGQWLRDQSGHDPLVVVNNPPSFFYQTGLRSIVIPDGDEAMLLAAARQFGAEWVVLDANRPARLAALYDVSDSEPEFRLAATFGTAHLLKIMPR
jgi:4-amino-4-deoxy-L-arabinose transferase-like glycosyltransferase